MSIVLGLNINHADSSACIIRNGELLFAVEEERINRINQNVKLITKRDLKNANTIYKKWNVK